VLKKIRKPQISRKHVLRITFNVCCLPGVDHICCRHDLATTEQRP